MKRCFKSPGFGKNAYYSLHYFSDASKDGYRQVSCVCLVDFKGNIIAALLWENQGCACQVCFHTKT